DRAARRAHRGADAAIVVSADGIAKHAANYRTRRGASAGLPRFLDLADAGHRAAFSACLPVAAAASPAQDSLNHGVADSALLQPDEAVGTGVEMRLGRIDRLYHGRIAQA